MTQSIDLRVLTSDELAIAVVPDLGGRIVELTDLSNGRQWLWRNHRVPFGPVASGSVYDDAWQGGFENCSPAMRRQSSGRPPTSIMESFGLPPGRLCTPTITPSS